MAFGKVAYDPLADALLCEFPVMGKDGSRTICGRWYRNLSRHILKHHKISVRQYKQLLGLDLTKSLISERMKSKLRKAVLKYGSDKNLDKGKNTRFKKGSSRIQYYKRSVQTKRRLLKSLDKAHKQKKVVKTLKV